MFTEKLEEKERDTAPLTKIGKARIVPKECTLRSLHFPENQHFTHLTCTLLNILYCIYSDHRPHPQSVGIARMR